MLDVLLVDDDEFVRGSIADALADAGHRIAQAGDGEQALALLARQSFDLAVCDVQMPRLDGLTLLRRLRHESPAMAVVMMTSDGTIPDVVGCLHGGAVDFVTKPFDPEAFAPDVVGPIDERRALMKRFEETRRRFVATEGGGEVNGSSLVMRQLVDRISVAANSDVSVFLSGERGTGKKWLAHGCTRRALAGKAHSSSCPAPPWWT